MRERRGIEELLCGALALGCVDEVPARFQEPERALTLLHTSDLHSRVFPFRSRISKLEAEMGGGRVGELREVGGMARLATALARERAQNDCLWLDSGDALEGSSVFRDHGGRVELDALSRLGLSAMALGNHELSLSAAELAELLEHFPDLSVLSANLVPARRSALEGHLVASKVVGVRGIRVGVVGVANPSSPPGLDQAGNPWQLVSSPLTAAVQRAVDDVAARCQLVVVLSHLGLEGDHALIRATHGIDLVLGGHQHFVTKEPEWEGAVPIVHSGAYGKLLSRLELDLKAKGDRLFIAAVRLAHLPINDELPEDPAIATLLETFRRAPSPPLALCEEPFRRRSPLGGDSSLGDAVTDSWRLESGADVVLLNSSGLRGDLEAGPLLRSDLELALPFDEPWLLVQVRGDELRRGLERAARRSAERDCESVIQVSGLELSMSCAACAAGRAGCLGIERSTRAGDSALRDDERLLLALPEYMARPGADFAELAASTVRRLDANPSDVLARWLEVSGSRGPEDQCKAVLAELSGQRCLETFGNGGCPPGAEPLAALCAELPWVRGARDGRIRLAP